MKRLVLFLALLLPALSPAANLASGEWFIDEDPGRGVGTSFAVTPDQSSGASVTIPAAALDALAPGYHLLGVRLLDDQDEWGHVVWRGFHKQEPTPEPSLAGGEWFIDEDPGFGQGTATPLPAEESASVSPEIPAATLDSLPDGYHLLGVRTRDAMGRWSHTLWRAFHIERTGDNALASVAYRILRDGEVVASGSADPGAGPIRHGHAGLALDENHLLETYAIDRQGRRGHAAYASFLPLRYADAWMRQHFTEEEIADPLVSGDDEDPDGDGLTNLEERWFALNPRNSGDAALAAASIELADAATAPSGFSVALDFRVPAGGSVGADGIYRTSNLRFTPRHNTDLGEWIAVPASWIKNWSLDDAGGGAARLRLELTPETTVGKRFFALEGGLE